MLISKPLPPASHPPFQSGSNKRKDREIWSCSFAINNKWFLLRTSSQTRTFWTPAPSYEIKKLWGRGAGGAEWFVLDQTLRASNAACVRGPLRLVLAPPKLEVGGL